MSVWQLPIAAGPLRDDDGVEALFNVGILVSPRRPQIYLCSVCSSTSPQRRSIGCSPTSDASGPKMPVSIARPSFYDFVSDTARCSDATVRIAPGAARRDMDEAHDVLLAELPWCRLTRLQLGETFSTKVAEPSTGSAYRKGSPCCADIETLPVPAPDSSFGRYGLHRRRVEKERDPS
ncbi:hypothetical protein BV25DRAFT_1920057 [Artomyces pyxidatus]|uniref:Uncharacterized protein n=1 Tax=Artomyces pyxidatus TaxID=48021 RepID=A0ACB8SPD1_9AGAM|nr:hypothetical protein BV25DRAFT_1920057 [Artomyces pyxidatus]